ncbi:MAG TPA: LLM class flavin-dependent oxidoreductase [Ktedonobacterales bacterium]|nr:LLM class flavin-dependent oxidoreductase [Ktedonobacterales bacterium]
MELGIYSFGDVQKDPVTGALGSTAEAMRNLLEAIKVADEVGLDYFGIGEHHTRTMPASAAATVLAGAATITKRIRLGSAVTVLSTDDPVRVFQQFATLDAISGGRAEITAGRGSSVESFPLFGYELADYDELFEEKLSLLVQLNELDEDERISWQGTYRAPLTDAVIVPRPHRGRLPIWRGTGGSPASSLRAGRQGLPAVYAIIGGQPARFAPLADLYRASAARAGHPAENIRVAVANMGFIHPDSQTAKEMWWPWWHAMWSVLAPVRGLPVPDRSMYDREVKPGWALFVGSPEEVAERIITLHGQMGHVRQIFQMDLGHVPQKEFLRSIELLGTRVKPLVDAALPKESAIPTLTDASTDSSTREPDGKAQA